MATAEELLSLYDQNSDTGFAVRREIEQFLRSVCHRSARHQALLQAVAELDTILIDRDDFEELVDVVILLAPAEHGGSPAEHGGGHIHCGESGLEEDAVNAPDSSTVHMELTSQAAHDADQTLQAAHANLQHVQLTAFDQQHRKVAAAAARERAKWGGWVPTQHAGEQVSSSLARIVLEQHLESMDLEKPTDITTREWNNEPNDSKKKKEAAEARLAESFDALLKPLLGHAAEAVGEVAVDIVGASEVLHQFLHAASPAGTATASAEASFTQPHSVGRSRSCPSIEYAARA